MWTLSPGVPIDWMQIVPKAGSLFHAHSQHRESRGIGFLAALGDSARPGKAATITAEARAWLVSLACQNAKDFGHPHEL